MDSILIVILASLLAPYIVVGLIIVAFAGRGKTKKDYSHQLSVSIFLPTYNEERNVARKLDNLLTQTYPIREILIFDCSTDKTEQIVKRYEKTDPRIKLYKQIERIGMARTLNEAFKIASGEIFVKTDCDSISSPSALKELVANFADERVGGATGICIADKGVEKYFRKFMTAIQIAETNIDSTLIAHATSLLAFRQSLVEPVTEDSLADDTEEFLLIRKKGFKTIMDPAVISHEDVPNDYVVRRKQKDRRSQGIIRVLLENIGIPFNPKYRKYGSMVLPLEWFILVLSPILLVVFGVVLGYALYTIHPAITIGLIALLAVALLKRSNIVSAIIDTQLSGLIGFIKSLSQGKNNGLWVKAQ
jgi:cellulose synthase/poly-beta-1,6-N-acetylglucosamine synthase-like glycosyltransferase